MRQRPVAERIAQCPAGMPRRSAHQRDASARLPTISPMMTPRSDVDARKKIAEMPGRLLKENVLEGVRYLDDRPSSVADGSRITSRRGSPDSLSTGYLRQQMPKSSSPRVSQRAEPFASPEE